jgi:CheY-like chemotaxis protein
MTGGGTQRKDERVVLYIEDVESSALLVDRALRRLPHVRVVMAKNGHEARELIASTSCDVILSDLNLPDVSGAEWVAELVASVSNTGIPVVVVSADATSASKESALAAGATGYLTKPVDLRELIAVVSELTSAPPAPPGTVGERESPPRALVDRYLAEAVADLARLRQAVAAGDLGSVESVAHRLRGSSAVFGADAVAALLDRLEVMAREHSLDGADGLVDEAEGALARFRVDGTG